VKSKKKVNKTQSGKLQVRKQTQQKQNKKIKEKLWKTVDTDAW